MLQRLTNPFSRTAAAPTAAPSPPRRRQPALGKQGKPLSLARLFSNSNNSNALHEPSISGRLQVVGCCWDFVRAILPRTGKLLFSEACLLATHHYRPAGPSFEQASGHGFGAKKLPGEQHAAGTHLIVTSARNRCYEHMTLRRALARCRGRRHFGWSSSALQTAR